MAYGDCRKQQTVRARPEWRGKLHSTTPKKAHDMYERLQWSFREIQKSKWRAGDHKTQRAQQQLNRLSYCNTFSRKKWDCNFYADYIVVIIIIIRPVELSDFVWIVRLDSSILVLCNIHTSATECCPLMPIAEFQIIITKEMKESSIETFMLQS